MLSYPTMGQNGLTSTPWRSRISKLIILLHVVAFVVCVTSGKNPSTSFVYLALGVGLSCFATLLVFRHSRVPVIQCLAIFLAVNYTGKLGYLIRYPEFTYLPILGKEGPELSAIVYEQYFSFGLAFLAFSIAALVTWRIISVFFQVPDRQIVQSKVSGFVLLAIASCSLLTLRFVLLHVFKIGLPSVISAQFSIPYVTGILNFLATKGTLLFISGFVAVALHKRSPAAVLFALFTAALYVLNDAAVGWRGPLFHMPFCIAWFVLSMEESRLKSKLKPMLFATLIVLPILFIPIMQYRNMINRGMAPLAAAQASLSFNEINAEDFIADIGKIANRIIGLDMYVIASYATQEEPLGIARVFDLSVGSFFTHEVMRVPKESVTAYASSFWGFWAMLVGDKWLWTGGVALGIAVSCLSALFLCRIQSPYVKTVVGCNLTILFIFFTMANGAIVLYAKETLMLFLGCVVFNWICGRTKPSPIALQNNQWPMHRAESHY